MFSNCSFSFLWGPVNHLKHLFSSERLLFTSVYFVSLFATLYFALSLQSTIFTSMAAIVQVAALLCFVLSNVPGGQTGLKFFSSICSSMVKTTVSKALPVQLYPKICFFYFIIQLLYIYLYCDASSCYEQCLKIFN